jgi:predicted metal-dependent phosphoesterase TrpH
MSIEVDLHLHTVESDGRLTPEELVSLVASAGIRVMAVTDHDTTFAIERAQEAARHFPGLTVIPGVELSCDVLQGEVHLLVYYLDYHDQEFQKTLAGLRDGRIGRAKKMVEKLAALGVPVPWERVLELADGGSVGRPHIAQAMMEAGYISTPQEAFAKYIGRTGPAYAEREKLTPVEAVKLARQVQGQPVLAHPAEIEDLERLLDEMKAAGLVGIEVYYASYDESTTARLAALARRFELVPCGGSDYHGLGYVGEVKPGLVGPPKESAERLAALAKAESRTAR